jgi:hypothetical protein
MLKYNYRKYTSGFSGTHGTFVKIVPLSRYNILCPEKVK